jgi:hypothetical protein
MKNPALRFYMHDGPDAFRFELAGDLDQEGARRLAQAWRTASSMVGDGRLIVDMTLVTSVDEQGRALISQWHGEGVSFVANSEVSRALAQSVLGAPLPAAAAPSVSDRSFRPSLLLRTVGALWLAAILFPAEASAATLSPETVAAWDAYSRTADASLQQRTGPGGSFLWSNENPERAAKVRKGEIVVAPASLQNPMKVPGGLIHHWIGAVFLPHTKLDDTLEVTRDYDRYKVFFRPNVIDSKAVARGGSEDRFYMLLMNRAFFRSSALEADYQATNVRVDDHRFYAVSRTTRMQEVEEYGRPAEYRKPEGEGAGYLWKLYGVARLEQHDDGVYIELEAVALSRDIPAAVRVVADPIVRRLSRNALMTSLQQTEKAVRSNTATAGRQPGVLRSAFAESH